MTFHSAQSWGEADFKAPSAHRVVGMSAKGGVE